MNKVWTWGGVAALIVGLLTLVPAARADRQAHFVAVGDFGALAATRTVLDGVAASNPTAAFALGDLGYKDLSVNGMPNEAGWCSFVKQSIGANFPFELIAGNHDSFDNPDGAINKYAACLPNKVPGLSGTYGREYYLDFPQQDPLVRVINASPALKFEDGTWAYQAGDAHYQWLSDAIDGGRAAGAKWIIVSAHKPCWTIGEHPCPTNTDFYKLLISKRVDLVLNGHEHGYMRTNQLVSGVTGCTTVPTSTFDADCVADSDGTYAAGAGTVFATVGTGGRPVRNVNLGSAAAGYFAASSGANHDPAFGYLDLQVGEDSIDAHFVTTSGGPFADSFRIGGGAPANRPPVAAFTPTVSGMKVTVNGSGSTDPDGSIASYSWNWGDSSANGSGSTTSHSYQAAGNYTVTLTVTDNKGLTATASRSVSVGAASPVVASDTFTRILASGLGSAQVGGAYTISGKATLYSVDGATAQMALTPGASRRALLRSVSAPAADATATIGFTGTLTGGGIYASLQPKVKADTSAYRAKVVINSSGVAKLSLTRVDASGKETALKSATGSLTGVTAARPIMVRAQVTGSSPTTIKARMWFADTAEPTTTWQVQTTDTTAALQGSGGIGMFVYESSSATAAVTARFDNLTASTL